MRSLLIGCLGACLALAVAALVYFAWDTHRMAKRGDAAATFLEQQIQRAQTAPQ